jgi:hypothetical protein
VSVPVSRLCGFVWDIKEGENERGREANVSGCVEAGMDVCGRMRVCGGTDVARGGGLV